MFAELIKTEIDFEVLQSGEAEASAFGTFIEGVPVAGGAARKYSGGLITTPSSQVDDINAIRGTQLAYARNLREWVGMGTIDPQFAFEEFERLEREGQEWESKLKLLIIQSAMLQSSPEEVQGIEIDNQIFFEVIQNGKLKAADVRVNGITPSVQAQFQTLQLAKKANA